MTSRPPIASPPAGFTCAQCHGTFPKAWSDEEAAAEAVAVFGSALGDDPAVVCDDCYKAMNVAVPVRGCPECETVGAVTMTSGLLPVCLACDWTGWDANP